MLSRVAERTYWMARYLERAENTARLINVYSALLLDLPESAEIDWGIVLEITGARDRFRDEGGINDETEILKFMLEDEDNPDSLLSSLNSARENTRTSRDLVPTEAWRSVNELCLYARKNLPKASGERLRSKTMSQIIDKVHGITGLLAGTMSQGQPYQFVRMGRNLERADMTTRIIDVAAATLMTGRDDLERYDNTLWMAVLRFLSAYQMYRQYVRRRVNGDDVIRFLLHDKYFPRSVRHCVGEVSDSLAQLPRSAAIQAVAGRMDTNLVNLDLQAMSPELVHKLVDDLQVEIAAINNSITQIWFYPADSQ